MACHRNGHMPLSKTKMTVFSVAHMRHQALLIRVWQNDFIAVYNVDCNIILVPWYPPRTTMEV